MYGLAVSKKSKPCLLACSLVKTVRVRVNNSIDPKLVKSFQVVVKLSRDVSEQASKRSSRKGVRVERTVLI